MIEFLTNLNWWQIGLVAAGVGLLVPWSRLRQFVPTLPTVSKPKSSVIEAYATLVDACGDCGDPCCIEAIVALDGALPKLIQHERHK